MKRLVHWLLAGGLIIALIAVILAAAGMPALSEIMAEFNPEIAFMRVPILVMTEGYLAGIVVAVVIAILLTVGSTKEKIFCRRTTRLLRYAGLSFGISFLFMMGNMIYSYSILGEEVGIMGVYLWFGAGAVFLAMLCMLVLANLFEKAVAFKEENELTV